MNECGPGCERCENDRAVFGGPLRRECVTPADRQTRSFGETVFAIIVVLLLVGFVIDIMLGRRQP